VGEVWLGDNRRVTLSSLLSYGAPDAGLVPYGMSPISHCLLSPLWGWRIRALLRRIELVSGKQCYSTQCHSRAGR
jgi:hypothetical protein